MLETDLVAECGNLKAAGRAAGANYARGEFGEDFGEFCQVSTSGGPRAGNVRAARTSQNSAILLIRGM